MSFSYTKTTGSMSEMQQLEDDFVSGNWVPPFLREAPTKKKESTSTANCDTKRKKGNWHENICQR